MLQTIDDRLICYSQGVAAFYEEVFGGPPEVTFGVLPGGDHAIVIENWIWLFYSGVEERWVARIKLPEGDPLFGRQGRLYRMNGLQVEKPSWEDALLWALEKETLRRFHLAQEDLPKRAA